MKKLIPLLLVVLTFAACEKDPDTDKRGALNWGIGA